MYLITVAEGRFYVTFVGWWESIQNGRYSVVGKVFSGCWVGVLTPPCLCGRVSVPGRSSAAPVRSNTNFYPWRAGLLK